MDIASIITAIGTIILGYFSYNQYTKNKMTDAKVKELENQSQKQEKKRNDNTYLVFGELWNLLYQLKAARVYIVQPHPLGREEKISIAFEVKRKGVESMQPRIQQLKISEIAKMSSDLVKNEFQYVTDINSQIPDRYARSMLSSLGCKHAIIKRLSNNEHDWVGSIFCEFTDDMEVSEKDSRDLLVSASTNIQFILPEFKD